MKNTLTDNPYLENIIKSIDRNMRLIEWRNDIDKIEMLNIVKKHCDKKMNIPPVENENV